VPVVANLRHHDIEPVFNETTLAEPAWAGLSLARRADPAVGTRHRTGSRPRQARRQPERKDYNFNVDWNADSRWPRPHRDRPSAPAARPLDKLVAELMIAANATWGGMLRDAGIPACTACRRAARCA
jgi:exoribonuclease-2